MGFLKTSGKALIWNESKEHIQTVKNQGLDQVVEWIVEAMHIISESPKFGYEMEFHYLKFDHENRVARIDLSATTKIQEFGFENKPFHLQNEFGNWMIEIVPDKPFDISNMAAVEANMQKMLDFLKEEVGGNKILSMGNYPMLGEGDFYDASDMSPEILEDLDLEYLKTNPYSKSDYFKDICINIHPRFKTLTRNLRLRRGDKPHGLYPIYKDVNTKDNYENEPFPGFIHTDSFSFGMGCCSFQTTLGTCTLNSALYLYDQLIPFTPILLALSASTPIIKGKLSGWDTRFMALKLSCDDRTEDERNPNSPNYIYKSRYDACYSYISEHEYVQEYHNDYPRMPINKEYYAKLIEHGIPHRFSEHICNLFVRDPLVIFDEKINIEDIKDKSHFLNLQSTNWTLLRLKPPMTTDGDSCFKIEVRPCEIQLTPFENSAMLSLIILLAKLIMCYDVNFIIPISQVDENVQRANDNDAVCKQKFFFRTDSIPAERSNPEHCKHSFLKTENSSNLVEREKNLMLIKELTIEEILCGSKEHNYPGILPLIYEHIERTESAKNLEFYKRHLQLIEMRAKGQLMTDAKYLRNYVRNHKEYAGDSIVSHSVNYDLLTHVMKIQSGEICPEELFGNLIAN